MRAIVVRAFTAPDQLRIEEIPEPRPGPGEVLIAVHSAGLTYGDALIATGRYQVKPALPFTPGSEGSGTIEAVGTGVTGYKPGDRVAFMGFVAPARQTQRILGTLSEKIVAPLRNIARIPDTVSLETAALFRSSTETSYHVLQRGGLQPGETLLVLGAGGGTGYAAVQLGKLMGARVIGSASSDAKRAISRAAGADQVMDSTDPDWRATLAALTEGRGPDVVYDPVGNSQTERAFRSLAYGGRLCVVGFAAGLIPKIPTNLALMKGISLVGANLLLAQENEPERIAANTMQLMAWLGEGRISVPPIASRYALEDSGCAYAEVLAGKTAGRIIVEIAPRSQY